MGALASGLLWALTVLLLLVLIAASLPLRLELTTEKRTVWTYRAVLRPLGRFGPAITLTRQTAPDDTQRQPEAPARDRKRGRSGVDLGRAVLRFGADILHRVRLTELSVDARFGTGDPAETGQTYGALAPLVYATAPAARVDVRLVPVFDAIVLEGVARIVVSLVPIRLVGPGLRFVWHAMRAAR